MAYVIGQARKIVKQNINQLENTTDPYSGPSTPSYSYYKLNENTDITGKTSLAAETQSRTILGLDKKPYIIIQKESASNPYSKYMLISNVSVDDDAH